MYTDRRSFRGALVAAALLAASPVGAHENPVGRTLAPAIVDSAIGRTGDPKQVTRTIGAGTGETLRFTPAAIGVPRGKAIRFESAKPREVMHERVLGTLQDLSAHAEAMCGHAGMEHEAPYLAHVAPGTTATIVWPFTRAGKVHSGCLVPGHFEARMIGKIMVRERKENPR